MLYPLTFKSVYKERVWGGRNLENLLGRKLPEGKIGESWDLCNHKNGMSIVESGDLAGETLAELMAEYKETLMGQDYNASGYFPLLIKVLDANDQLSVQVHPDDEYAYKVEKEAGKTEAWYVLAAKADAKIIYGLKEEITKEAFRTAVKAGNVMACLREVPVKKGDLIYVPSGSVHALLEGVVVYEVQQNSNTTYRVYDYNRVDQEGQTRELHTEKALEVISFGGQAAVDFNQDSITCPYFKMQKMRLEKEIPDATQDRLLIYCIISGQGKISYRNGAVAVRRGETVLIPAELGEFKVSGGLEFLRISTRQLGHYVMSSQD